ncbi:MAG: COX15/CtaA family protein [Alphaproteobacteria bacterium]|nr:COX15/CtaA family protein [Alphaproteobacteria bacterium]MBU0859703.1 COX15/CtaA family protein [Alphaproteobacteria bacterium]
MNNVRPIIIWLHICCFMVLAMAVIGAVTRLTESGLSITEWKPVMGALPPLSETAWQEEFAKYQQSPEFLHKHNWMELHDFKKIFFWEWLHRLWGRAIGMVYLLPLLWFAARKQIPPGTGWKFTGLLALGGLQGFVGWWMVKSGLIDRPSVSHFRLATHLGLALVLFSLLFWLALDLKNKYIPKRQPAAWAALALLSVTIIWGAFVAGLDAGLIYNTFPLMNGSFLPPEPLQDFLHQHAWVQFTHRWLAMFTAGVLLWLGLKRQDNALVTMVLIQISLGIATLISQVMIPLAALHQAGAVILLALLLRNIHKYGR